MSYLSALPGLAIIIWLSAGFLYAVYLLVKPSFENVTTNILRVTTAVSFVLWLFVLVFWAMFSYTVGNEYYWTVWLAVIASLVFVASVYINGLVSVFLMRDGSQILKWFLFAYYAITILVLSIGALGLVFLSMVANMTICSLATHGHSDICGSLRY